MNHCQVLHGDCLELLASLPAESVDACVTDPPYGIGFMGKEWDTFKPGTGATRKLMHPRERAAAKLVSENPNIHGRHRSPALSPSQIDYDYSAAGLRKFQDWTEQWAREVLRVLKPGAYAVVCGAPRAYHRMACGLEDAGFEIRDCLAWLFGSGFPKSLNIGDGLGTALKPAHEPIVLARKPFKGTVKGNVEKFGTGALNIDACRIRFASEDDKAAAAAAAAARRAGHQKAGQGVYEMGFTDGLGSIPAYLERMDMGRWPANVALDELAAMVLDEQSGELTSGSFDGNRTSDKFPNAYGEFKGAQGEREYEGNSGGASRFYKVCPQDCILCGSPTDEHGKMSECETTSVSSAERRFRTIHQIIASTVPAPAQISLVEQLARRVLSAASLCAQCATSTALALVETKRSDSRRAVFAAFRDSIPSSKSSTLSQNLASFAALWVNTDTIPTTASLSLLFGSVEPATDDFTNSESLVDVNGLPRFLYSAKPSREERDMGCYSLPARSGGEATNRVDGSAGLNNPRAGAGRTGGGRNFHPTVKPVELMRWLVKLVTPINGTVIDPFMGSGTTGMACRYEQRGFIGIEREADYLEIAKARIGSVAPLFQSQPA